MGDQTRFYINTYGCQMNVHDSEKLASLLLHAEFSEADSAGASDLLIINTCSIRDKAENQLYSDLGKLKEWKTECEGRILGVGGCVAQQVGDAILKRFPHVDFVFGTHNVRLVPAMVASARGGERTVDTRETRSLSRFDLPERHPGVAEARARSAFVTVMEGCDMFCSFCIVPTTRGREISRPAEAILAEARALADSGVLEITLLGQTVNAYGRHDVGRGQAAAAGTMAFADLLARLDEIPGLERIRYTSPHPLFFDQELIAAHAELRHLCPHVHLPLQSGSSDVLSAMRRRYTGEGYREVVAGLASARPDIAITTDLIVGFPGETRAHFEDTLSLVREVGFVDSYSFKYSPRPGTGAAELPGAVDAEEAQRRLVELQTLQRELTIGYHRSRVGRSTEILIQGQSRRGGGQVCGRDPYHRIVNLVVAEGDEDAPRPCAGSLVAVDVVEATPHSLLGTLGAEARAINGNPGSIPGTAVKLGQRSADEQGRSASEVTTSSGLLQVIS